MHEYLYKPLTDEQLALAEKLMANMDLAFHTGRFDPETRYHAGILIPGGVSGNPIRVMVTEENYRVDGRVLICDRSFPTLNPVELICAIRGGETVRIRGWAEASRPAEQLGGEIISLPPLHVSFFHPKRLGP